MAVSFDGPSKRMILSSGTTSLSVQALYSSWKEWVMASDNAKYPQAMSAVGGDPLPGSAFLGSTYFLENGWKIRPQEADHTLTVSGNIYSRDGSNVIVSTLGTYNVLVSLRTSNLVDAISTAGGGGSSLTADEVVSAILDNADTVESGLTVRKALRLLTAVMGGRVSGGRTGTERFRAAVSNSKERVVVAADANGNRTSVTTDLT